MRLKILALLAGVVIVQLCMLSGIQTPAINLVGLFQTSTFTITPSTATKTLTPTRRPSVTRKPTKTATPIPTRSSPTATNSTISGVSKTSPIVIYAAGDIADCNGAAPDQSTGAMITSDMLLKTSGPIFTLGDNSNDQGTQENYHQCYNPTWGRLLERTFPVMGNHDMDLNNKGAAYFAYFAGRTGKLGHYSLDLGTWHIVILNAECSIGHQHCQKGSLQEQWLRADLAATRQKCILALWHQPLFTSGQEPEFAPAKSFWVDLYKYQADIILNGHNHLYERFDPLDPDGVAAANGIREFVVGTGGAFLDPPISPPAYGEIIRNATTFGYLKLTLFADSYQWQFVPQPGQYFTDSGTANCHR